MYHQAGVEPNAGVEFICLHRVHTKVLCCSNLVSCCLGEVFVFGSNRADLWI